MKTLSSHKALLLFSGGQDSAVCLAWALSRFDVVETIGFDYGQRHHVELEARQTVRQEFAASFPQWAEKLGPDRVINLTALAELGDNALTSDTPIAETDTGLPTTFVPGRNILFLAFAGAYAYNAGLQHIVTGVCETDYSGYPDCRDDTMKAMNKALNLGMETDFQIHTPLMFIDKAATWKMAEDLGGERLVNLILEHTHTCYTGERAQRHEWGYGCGTCPACELRAKGYAAYCEYT